MAITLRNHKILFIGEVGLLLPSAVHDVKLLGSCGCPVFGGREMEDDCNTTRACCEVRVTHVTNITMLLFASRVPELYDLSYERHLQSTSHDLTMAHALLSWLPQMEM